MSLLDLAASGAVDRLRAALGGAPGWLLAACLGTTITTLTVWAARRWLDRRSLRSLGLVADRRALEAVAFGWLVAATMQATVFAIHLAAGWIVSPRFAWETLSLARIAGGLATMTVVFALVGWHEELLMRGYWLQNLADGFAWLPGTARGLNRIAAVVLSSSVFALAHVANPHANWASALGIFAAGLFLAFAYVRTGQLWLAMGLHWGWNLFQGPILGLPVSGIETVNLVEYEVEGPALLTGGAFGPEAGLVLVPALALGVLAIHWYARAPLAPAAERASADAGREPGLPGAPGPSGVSGQSSSSGPSV
jgi:membrane protease YdiL (CAAX protease family)